MIANYDEQASIWKEADCQIPFSRMIHFFYLTGTALIPFNSTHAFSFKHTMSKKLHQRPNL
jgi:hypothetical protein